MGLANSPMAGVRIRVGLWHRQGPAGTVLLFPGRTEYVEKYGRTARLLAARGLATLVIDWRGQGIADRLVEVLKAPQGNPLTPETLVVQHPGMARWLSLRLAERLGVCANVEFPLPAAFVWRLLATLVPDLPDHNRFEPAVLVWRILGQLDALPGEPALAPLHAYLDPGDGDPDPLKRLQLAQNVWRAMKETDSRECRNCHQLDSMDLEEQDRSARKKHAKAEEKGKTCIDCHKGIAHSLPDMSGVDASSVVAVQE